MMYKTISLCGMALALSSLAMADINGLSTNANSDGGFYTGLQLGRAKLDYDKTWIGSDLIYPPVTVAVEGIEDSGFAGRVYVGYDWNQWVGTEVGYLYLPKVVFKGIASMPLHKISFKSEAFDVFMTGKLTLPNSFEFKAKLGLAEAKRYDLDLGETGVVAHDKTDSHIVPAAGVGVGYYFTPQIATDLSYMKYFGGNTLKPTEFMAIGMSYLFGN